MDALLGFFAFLFVFFLFQYLLLREVGNLDGDRKDWWERLEDFIVELVNKFFNRR